MRRSGASTDMVTVLVPAGSLGTGVREEEVAYGIAAGAHVIASDAGSTDSGAAYLALGISKNTREAVKNDLVILMKAQAEAGIPLIVGSCGQAGGNSGLQWTADIVVEIARELALTPRVALLHSEQDAAVLKRKNAQGKIHPLPPLGSLDDATIDACDHIVAAMGPEPYIAALADGADIILGGRTTDTAVLAAYPLYRGIAPAPVWHAAKVAECGAQCTVNPSVGRGVMMRIENEGFDIEPADVNIACSTHSVSAHMLYENSDPFRLIEPGGILDVTGANYQQLDARTVRVTGSRWEPMPYTMKLEGAAGGPYQTIMMVGIEDPAVLSQLDLFHHHMLAALNARVERTIGHEAGDYDISLRIYGWNAVSGQAVPRDAPPPREVGVLCVTTAATQSLATRIAKTCNPLFFHLPISANIELPSYGFAFSPAEIERGRVYEFKLNHVVETTDAFELISTSWIDLRSRLAASTV